MSSGFPFAGGPELYNYAPGRRSTYLLPALNNNNNNHQHLPYGGILTDQASNILQHHRRRQPDWIGKRSLAEFQHHQQQEDDNLSLYCRKVRTKLCHQASSPVSLVPPVDFSSINSQIQPGIFSGYSLPADFNNNVNNSNHNNGDVCSSFSSSSTVSYQSSSSSSRDPERNMMSKLKELEKELLDDNDGESEAHDFSIVTNSEWSDTIQSLISPNHNTLSPSPTSPSLSSSLSSSCSSAAFPSGNLACPKQLIMDAASSISEGKLEVASEILTRLTGMSNVKGTSEQRLTAYLMTALRSRVDSIHYRPPVSELFTKEHVISTQMLYEVSPCFKLGFMAANLAILEATAVDSNGVNKLHVIDFDIGQGGQYVHLLYALASKRDKKSTVLKITTFKDFNHGGEERLQVVGDGLKALARKVGVSLIFNIMDIKPFELSHDNLGLEVNGEALAVNLAFWLYKLPDESVTTENLRDELLRRVKRLSPTIVTVVEQEINANTASFSTRVSEAYGYYGALFDSLDSTVSKESLERVKIEKGLGQRITNSVACEGRDRVERCEVFGKWRARMGMAGFKPKPMSQLIADSLRSKLSSGTRGNPGFTVNEHSGGIHFGWMERSLTVASSWQ